MPTTKTELQEFIDTTWSDYSDLDYWIEDMSRGSDSKHIPKHVMKMAMKHLRDDLHSVHAYLCRLEEREREMTRAHTESLKDFLEVMI